MYLSANIKEKNMFTIRSNVTLFPYCTIPYTRYTINGFVGAYEGETPIPECLPLTLGTQKHLFIPYEKVDNFIDDTVIYAGRPSPAFGHFLLDSMSRLWYAKNNPNITIIWDTERNLFDSIYLNGAKHIFNLVGIKNKNMFLEKKVRIKNVIFPFPGISIGNYFLKDHEIFLGVYKCKNTISGKKLYLSRKKIKNAPVKDEDIIEKLVSSYGFEIFYPEEHSIEKQLDAISSSEIVLGIEGSAFYSVVLLKRPISTRFYAIARHRRGGGVYNHIKNVKNIDYTTLNIYKEPLPRYSTDSLVIDILLFKKILKLTNGLEKKNNRFLNPYIINNIDNSYLYYIDVLGRFKTYMSQNEIELYKKIVYYIKNNKYDEVPSLVQHLNLIRFY